MAYKTKIKKVRVQVGAFSAEQMMQIGQPFAASIKSRIQRGVNVNDEAAKPLSANYARSKGRRGLQITRDWTWTGRTMRALNLLDVSANRGRIGFSDPVADQRAHFNNARDRQFGVSNTDRNVLRSGVKSAIVQGKVARWVSDSGANTHGVI